MFVLPAANNVKHSVIEVVEFIDPIVSANIYCAGQLDAVVCEVVRPFWQELGDGPGPAATAMWMVRYGRCGEHLKLRLHGAANVRDRCVKLLGDHVERYFNTLDSPSPEGERNARTDVPAIDAADERVTLYPDRTLLWTDYRRSAVSLGSEPFLSNDRYAALATTCLVSGCQIVLATLQIGNDGVSSNRERQNVLLRSVIDVLAVLGWTCQRRDLYLRYHRDWLLRFGSRSNEDEEARLLGLFADETQRLGPSLGVLARVLREHPGSQAELTDSGNPGAIFSWSLLALIDYAEMICRNPRYYVDPIAPDPVFPVLFKVLHGLANQLGLKVLVEAFVYDLLLCAGNTDHG